MRYDPAFAPCTRAKAGLATAPMPLMVELAGQVGARRTTPTTSSRTGSPTKPSNESPVNAAAAPSGVRVVSDCLAEAQVQHPRGLLVDRDLVRVVGGGEPTLHHQGPVDGAEGAVVHAAPHHEVVVDPDLDGKAGLDPDRLDPLDLGEGCGERLAGGRVVGHVGCERGHHDVARTGLVDEPVEHRGGAACAMVPATERPTTTATTAAKRTTHVARGRRSAPTTWEAAATDRRRLLPA